MLLGALLGRLYNEGDAEGAGRSVIKKYEIQEYN